MRLPAGWVLVGLLLWASGCALEAVPVGEDGSEVVVVPAPQPLAGDLESFVVQSPRPASDVWLDDDVVRLSRPDLEPVTDPCSCTSEACFDHWVDHNLGCDVCVVLYCDEMPGRHLCNHCDDGSGHDHGVDGPHPQ
jgi:hypothetical protein